MKDSKQDINKLSNHFFRHSYAKMVAILVRYFGLSQVEIAEDIVQDTLVEATQKWSTTPIPENPEGWLMDVAKKKTINILKRNQLFANKIVPKLKTSSSISELIQFSDAIEMDSTLRMIFTCCHPSLSKESQIALALKSLCGLSAKEIANALLTNENTINKRLYRAKEKFRDSTISFKIPSEKNLSERLDNVLSTLYLLFNEGYYSSHSQKTIRIDFCFEAIRLLKEISVSYPKSYKAKALLSLMFLSVARFESRLDQDGALVILSEQDRELWDKSLIEEGINYLHQSLEANKVNSYQLQAGIAAEYCLATSFESTNWSSVYKQYLILEKLDNGPIIKFNMAIAKFYTGYKKEALEDLLLLKNEASLNNNVHYYTSIGVFYLELNQREKALSFFETALKLSTSKQEEVLIKRKIST